MTDNQNIRQLVDTLWTQVHNDDSPHTIQQMVDTLRAEIHHADASCAVDSETIVETGNFVLGDVLEQIREQAFTREWSGKLIVYIISTIRDNLETVTEKDKQFLALVEQYVLQQLVDTYVEQLFVHKHSFKLDNRTSYRLRQDLAELEYFFKKTRHRSKDAIDDQTNVVHNLNDIFSTNLPALKYIPIYLKALLQENLDFTLPIFEFLLGLRADLSKDSLREVLAVCRPLFADRPPNNVGSQGIFNRLDLERKAANGIIFELIVGQTN